MRLFNSHRGQIQHIRYITFLDFRISASVQCMGKTDPLSNGIKIFQHTFKGNAQGVGDID